MNATERQQKKAAGVGSDDLFQFKYSGSDRFPNHSQGVVPVCQVLMQHDKVMRLEPTFWPISFSCAFTGRFEAEPLPVDHYLG